MKKITSLIIVFSMLVAMLACFDVSTAFAATNGNCGANFGGTNAKWSLNTSTGVLTISGKGLGKIQVIRLKALLLKRALLRWDAICFTNVKLPKV